MAPHFGFSPTALGTFVYSACTSVPASSLQLRLVDWLIGWLVGWLVGLLVDGLVGWVIA